MRAPFFLHIDIDAFFAAVEVLMNPGLRGLPLVIGGSADERGVVCTASYEARVYGIHSGMALRTAAQRCPHAVFLRGRHSLYKQVSDRFFNCLQSYSPLIEMVSIDEAYLDLSGFRYLAASVYDLAQEIKETVQKEIGLSVSAGLAHSRLGAKLATEAAKPGGLCWLHDEQEWLDQVSLEKIPGIGPHTLVILRGLGVSRGGELRRRYLALWKRFIGSATRKPPGRRPAERKTTAFSRETTFPDDIGDQEMVEAHLAYLADRLAMHLLRVGLYAGRIEVKLRFSDFSTHTKRCFLPYPTRSCFRLRRAAASLCRTLRQKRRLPLRLVGVKVDDLQRDRNLLPIFSSRGEDLSGGIGRVKDKFGAGVICSGREMLLGRLYVRERDGLVLKTASLTK